MASHQKGDFSEEQEELESPAPLPTISSTAGMIAGLSRDYEELARLMVQLDKEVGSFTSNMTKLNNSIPEHAGLTALWEEQAKVLRGEIRDARETGSIRKLPANSRQQKKNDKDNAGERNDAPHTGDSHNKNDKLVFI